LAKKLLCSVLFDNTQRQSGALFMARKPARKLDESTLTKMQLRKLNALRKSVGDEIGSSAFHEWLETQPEQSVLQTDRNATRIADALRELIDAKKLTIPRGGYILRRGRGRVIVEPAK
jgi:hypothetical protein